LRSWCIERGEGTRELWALIKLVPYIHRLFPLFNPYSYHSLDSYNIDRCDV
jgi:hypothetical protein